MKVEKLSILNAMHIMIKVQSNKYDAEYLEHRINEFLNDYIECDFSVQSVESNKDSIINVFKQGSRNL